MFRYTLWYLAVHICPLWALNVTAPAQGEIVDMAKNYTIRWAPEASDPAQVSVELLNATANQPYVVNNIIRGANTSDGEYAIYWPAVIPNTTLPYRLVFITRDTGSYLNQSGIFNLTLPYGESQNTTNGAAPANPNTTPTVTATFTATPTPPEATSASPGLEATSGLSKGAIAAAVVVPVVLLTIAVFAGFFILQRRRQRRAIAQTRRKSNPDSQYDSKPELENQAVRAKNELDNTKDYTKWELPTTPPRPATPAEMPAHVPLAEMATPMLAQETSESKRYLSGSSDNATTVAGSNSEHKHESAISPTSSETPHGRASVSESFRGSVASPARTGRETPANTTNGRSKFAEALYDLVSDELRRPD